MKRGRETREEEVVEETRGGETMLHSALFEETIVKASQGTAEEGKAVVS